MGPPPPLIPTGDLGLFLLAFGYCSRASSLGPHFLTPFPNSTKEIYMHILRTFHGFPVPLV
jgi:hypothetical protein